MFWLRNRATLPNLEVVPLAGSMSTNPVVAPSEDELTIIQRLIIHMQEEVERLRSRETELLSYSRMAKN
jgi:hypothetical protein